MYIIMEDFLVHFKKEYPFLTQYVDYSDYKNKIPYADLCFGTLVKLKKDTRQNDVINFTKQDIMRENERASGELYVLYKGADSPILYALDAKGNKYKAFQNDQHQLNPYIVKNETVVYNIPLRDINYFEINSGVMTLSRFMSLASKIHYDITIQNLLTQNFNFRTVYEMEEMRNPTKPSLSAEEFEQHLLTAYKDLIALNKKTVGYYDCNKLQVATAVNVLEQTAKKTWVNVLKNTFELNQPNLPFSMFLYKSDIQPQNCLLENINGEQFKPVNLSGHQLNYTLQNESAMYNIALNQLYNKTFQNLFGDKLSDLVLVAFNRRMQTDGVLQQLFTDIAKTDMVLSHTQNTETEMTKDKN